MRLSRTLAIVVAATSLATSAILAADSAMAKASIPYSDHNANGYIGFCDKNKHQITSGTIYDQPFIWTAVSSTPAPAGYEKGKAILIAYQPRKDATDPQYWSGRQLTSPSTFTNAKHPMSQATYADDPLLFFKQQYPPAWDGLVELRMYFSIPDGPVHQIRYPATNIRISGDYWSVVDGGTVDCKSGSATSIEVRTNPNVMTSSPPPLIVDGKVAKASRGAAPSPAASAPADTVAEGSRGGDGGIGVVAIGLVAVALLGGGAGGLYVWRRAR